MAHKTMINGTAYDVTGGKTMVGSTVYSIKSGKTLIDGTEYDISFGPPIINISIDKVTYQAEQGMTWGEWVESSYNTGGYSLVQVAAGSVVGLEGGFLKTVVAQVVSSNVTRFAKPELSVETDGGRWIHYRTL